MASEEFQKLRAHIVLVVIALVYPVVLLVSWLYEAYSSLPGRKIPKSIAGEIAVVTGSANGLGKAISIELAKKGCHVAIVDVDLENAENTAKEIQERYGVKTKAYKVDVSSFSEVEKLNEDVTKDLGPTTILVNNAGLLAFKDFFRPTSPETQKMINVNLTAHFWTINVFLPKMKELRKGHIVCISSASALFPIVNHPVYSSTKCAVLSLMRSLKMQLIYEKYTNIHTTTVMPMFLTTNARVKNITQKTYVDAFYPLISGEEGAKKIIEALQLNKSELVFPGMFRILYRLVENLSVTCRDYIVLFAAKPSLDIHKKMEKHNTF